MKHLFNLLINITNSRVARLHHTGLLQEGKRADILLFDETHKLTHTIIAGETAWKLCE